MRGIKNLLIFFIIMLMFALSVSAEDITMAVNQTEYYFTVGEQAVIPLEVENTYGKRIDGMIKYSIVQETNQGGFSYSSTNTQSQSFPIEGGEHVVNLGFGSSNQPVTLKVDLSFTYTEEENRIVDLEELLVHFVQDESEKKNEENRKECSSQEQSEQQKQEAQNQMQQKMQQMQQQMDNLFKNPAQQQDAQQRVQNNQMQQDSNALKQQLEKQMQEQQKMREEFQKNLEQNEEFMKEHQELMDKGYKQSSGDLNPSNSTSGEFELNYEKEGETASLKGSMENNEINEMQKESSEDDKKVMEELQNDERFQKYDKELKNDNFEQQSPKIERQGNVTNVEIPYTNSKNETATIKAKIEDDGIKDVELERERKNLLFYFLVIILLVIIGIFLYKKYFKKELEEIRKAFEKPIDFRKEALKILGEAKKLFKAKKEKDAYGKAAEAIRFYYSYKVGSKIEVTNTELIKMLKKNKIKYTETQKCLNLTSLVEFAKYKANKEDFKEIVKLGERIIQ